MASASTIEPRLMHILNQPSDDVDISRPSRLSSQGGTRPDPSDYPPRLPKLDDIVDTTQPNSRDAPNELLPRPSELLALDNASYRTDNNRPRHAHDLFQDTLPVKQTPEEIPQEGSLPWLLGNDATHTLPSLDSNGEGSFHPNRQHDDWFERPGSKRIHSGQRPPWPQLPVLQNFPPSQKQPSGQDSSFPPMIVGIDYNPPPQSSATLPRIQSFPLDDAGPLHSTSHPPSHPPSRPTSRHGHEPAALSGSDGGKARKRVTRRRRQWTKEETDDLLRGIYKHGMGKWTDIRNDPDFTFNDRSAGDLKDRCRTVWPRSHDDDNSAGDVPSSTPAPERPRKGLYAENILHDSDTPNSPGVITPPREHDAPVRVKKKRSHRREPKDLEALELRGPLKHGNRRPRRPFTDQEDSDIKTGLLKHGSQWTKIRNDPELHLQSRAPTDLRDRVRNMSKTVFKDFDEKTFEHKPSMTIGGSTLEPTIALPINTLFPKR